MFEQLNECYNFYHSHGNPVVAQDRTLLLFYDLVKQSPYSIWSPGDAVKSNGIRILIGVAVDWNPYDRTLLMCLEAATNQGLTANIHIDLFDTGVVQKQEDFSAYFPEYTEVVMWPIVGIWKDGTMTGFATGHKARLLLEGEIPAKFTLE